MKYGGLWIASLNAREDGRREAGFDLSDKLEILGTLYNIEDIDNPIEPHSNPKVNEFGKGVGENYEKVKGLLRL